MATAVSHAAAALAIGCCFPRHIVPRRILLAGALLAIAPDLDAIGHWLGVPSRALIGHRGLTHSLTAALLGGVVAAYLLTRGKEPSARAVTGVYLVLAIMSHGALDALTNGGSGIAFFSPFSNARFFFPFRPLQVPPISANVFNARGVRIFASELRWVLLPAALLAGFGLTFLRGGNGAVPAQSRPA